MTASLILACLWAVAANLVAVVPSRRNHWPQAYLLIAAGVPIVGFVTYENGPWVGLLVLAAGVSVLRWPVWHLARWVRRQVLREEGDPR